MALIECPECNKRISSFAERCPNCGLPKVYFETDNLQSNEAITQKLKVDFDEPEVSTLETFSNILKSFEFDYNNVFSHNEYISNSEKKAIFDRYYKYFNKFVADKNLFSKIQAEHADMRIEYKLLISFAEKMRKLDASVDEHNEKYVLKAVEDNKEYLDNILKDIDPNIKLDDEQRKAVVTDDDYCLLIAGAGAGKTTTMAAKVKWLVEKKNVKPNEIMLISYTNKAIDELRERVNNKMKIPAKILTFHSFAFDIVKSSVDKRPEVNFTSYKIISEMIEKKLFKDNTFMKKIILFLGYYFNVLEEAFDFESLDEYHLYKASQEYNTLKGDLEKYIENVEKTRSKYASTLTGERMRSASEVQIANFLYLNGIDYQYEKVYPHRIENARKEYTPDFYIFQEGKEAYIEHYGINQDYTSKIYDEKTLEKYKKAIEDKRKLHCKYETNLIETWNSYTDGTILKENLEKELKKHGFVFRKRNVDEVYEKITQTSKDKYMFKFIYFMMEFIERYKTEGYGKDGFEKLRKKTNNIRTLMFLELAEVCYDYYQNYLEEHNQVDFADMINEGTKYLSEIQKREIKLPYKYIIIDEFQDIATQRFNFTKKLSQVTGAKVVAVGDDWQSIYAFAGADISLFTRFLELLGSGKELQITHTYRNSQELIDIAGGFIQKNSNQIRKKLVSPKHLCDPIQIESFNDGYQLFNNLAERTTDMIGKIIDEYGINSSILLIGRYNFDKNKLTKTNYFDDVYSANGKSSEKIICKKYPNANITYMTAHSSKGLGYDNVILINMLEGKFGFPSQIAVDPIMKLVLHEDNSIAFSEERRLLYVALTRTKNRVYIVAPQNRPSRFLLELIKDYNIKYDGKINMDIVKIYTKKCPKCGYPLKKEFNGRIGLPLWICSNEPEVCDFMTNSDVVPKDIFRCPVCDGYMIVKKMKDKQHYFYGCTNYNSGKGCLNILNFDEIKMV